MAQVPTPAVQPAVVIDTSVQIKSIPSAGMFVTSAPPQLQALSPVTFTDVAGSLTFTPTPDITVVELATILNMFISLMMRGDMRDWRAHIVTNGLSRHFI